MAVQKTSSPNFCEPSVEDGHHANRTSSLRTPSSLLVWDFSGSPKPSGTAPHKHPQTSQSMPLFHMLSAQPACLKCLIQRWHCYTHRSAVFLRLKWKAEVKGSCFCWDLLNVPYFKTCQHEGTPFKESGETLKRTCLLERVSRWLWEDFSDTQS